MNMGGKIVKKIKTIFSDTKYNIQNFGLFFGIHFLICSLTRKYMYLNRKLAINILENKFDYVLRNIEDNYTEPKEIDLNQKTIYFFWAQGFESVPSLVNRAISLAKCFYSDYTIVQLDLNN